jgi:N-acetylglucosaminyldiphosphoundecaprenol N-acetyl-beta-D-mannosaminyltransferase
LQVTNYAELTAFSQNLAAKQGSSAVDFTNTHIVTMRRHQNRFAKLTRHFDLFIPDGMPLVWCLNFQGAGLKGSSLWADLHALPLG